MLSNAASVPQNMGKQDMKQKADKIVDRADAPDIFCDGALSISFRHDICRIALHADRLDPADGKTVNRVVVGHLTMPPACFVDLYNKMSQAMEHLKKAGVVKPAQKAPVKPS